MISKASKHPFSTEYKIANGIIYSLNSHKAVRLNELSAIDDLIANEMESMNCDTVKTVEELVGATIYKLAKNAKQPMNVVYDCLESINNEIEEYVGNHGVSLDLDNFDLSNFYFDKSDEKIKSKDGKIVRDNYLVSSLDLSVRSKHYLEDNNITTFGQVVDLQVEGLQAIKNLGAGSVAEITQKVLFAILFDNNVLPDSGIQSEDGVFPFSFDGTNIVSANGKIIIHDAPITELYLSKRSNNGLSRLGFTMISSILKQASYENAYGLGKTSIKEISSAVKEWLNSKVEEYTAIYGKGGADYLACTPDALISIFKRNPFKAFSYQEISDSFSSTYDDSSILQALNACVKDGRVTTSKGLFSLKLLSFEEKLNGLIENSGELSAKDRASLEILRRHFIDGDTLEIIGNSRGLTRERIRQIEGSFFKKYLNKEVFTDDKYAYVFETYNLDFTIWHDYIKVSDVTYRYLLYKYLRGKADYEDILSDDNVSVDVKIAIRGIVYKGFVLVNDEYVKKSAAAIVERIMSKYDETKKDDDIIPEFRQFIIDNNLSDDPHFDNKINDRRIRSILVDSKKTLSLGYGEFRYYDLSEHNFEKLFETISQAGFTNIKISANKIFESYPDLMREYDIRNYNELHNLLKKTNAEKFISELTLGRNPSLIFGDYSEEEFLEEIIRSNSPISQTALSSIIADLTGFNAHALASNIDFSSIGKYRTTDGRYSIDAIPLTKTEEYALTTVLKEDIYKISEVCDMCLKIDPNFNIKTITPAVIERCGYHYSGNWVIKDYATITDYFRTVIDSYNDVDLNRFNPKVRGTVVYYARLFELKSNYDIIFYEKDRAVKFETLAAKGFTKDDVQDFIDTVYGVAQYLRYFTIPSLRQMGITSKFDSLGYGNMFYEELLKYCGKFKYIDSSTVIFSATLSASKMYLSEFIRSSMERDQAYDADKYLEALNEKYGTTCDKGDLYVENNQSEIYYDKNDKMLYYNYREYLDSLEENE